MTSANTDIIALAETWIESAAVDQLTRVAALPGILRAVGMPDLHPGKGSPIGAAFLSESIVYPHLVGSDIGCGMGLFHTGVKVRKVKLDKLEKRLDLDEGAPDEAEPHLQAEGAATTGHEASLGTVGGGNHFAELVRVEAVRDPERFEALALDAAQTLLLVHSGSRGLGHAIAHAELARTGAGGVTSDSEDGQRYLAAHDNAVRWARANRSLIAARFLKVLGGEGPRLLDITHNSVTATEAGLWLHRKGAAPADAGPIIIPGSRGDLSYIVDPVGTGERNLHSLAHGAGRKWARAEVKGKLGAKANVDALKRTKFGSRVICENKKLLFEEAPQAYKPASSVINALVEARMIRVVAELAPLLTYKTRERT